MRFPSSLIAFLAASLVYAAPIKRDNSSASGGSTGLVFQFAEVLEHLETEFYGQALKKFQASDFIAAGFPSAQLPIQQFQSILEDEETHDKFLQAGLKSINLEPVQGCQFNFDSVLTDVETMITTARAVENVGVGAYLGGATLLSDPVIVDEAASILTVEARHQTVNNILAGGTAIFSAFDVPLAPNEVLAIAGSFISGCSLGIQANPSLTITNSGTIGCGSKLEFKADAISGSEDNLFCQMLVGGATAAMVMPLSQCVVPEGMDGLSYVFITNDSQPLLNDVRDRASSEVVAGPAVLIVKEKVELLGSLVSGGSKSGSSDESVTVQTISPGDASSIISSASATLSSNGAPSPSLAADASISGGSSSGGPNLMTGLAANGTITVNGISSVPVQQPVSSAASASPAASAAASASPAASAAGGYGRN